MEKIRTYNVIIMSGANKHDLSDDQVSDIFKSYFSKKYQRFRNNMLEGNKKYDNIPLAKWQLAKAKEFEDLWHNNIKYVIENNIVRVTVDFNIELPDDWDKSDVITWAEGFSRLNNVLLMYQMEKLAKDNTYKINKEENKFVKRLIANQKFIIDKI